VTNYAQTFAKVLGSSYDISEMIIKPSKVVLKENGVKTEVSEGRINI
jgi:hypothetical protein